MPYRFRGFTPVLIRLVPRFDVVETVALGDRGRPFSTGEDSAALAGATEGVAADRTNRINLSAIRSNTRARRVTYANDHQRNNDPYNGGQRGSFEALLFTLP
jgi:hypothetical protein